MGRHSNDDWFLQALGQENYEAIEALEDPTMTSWEADRTTTIAETTPSTDAVDDYTERTPYTFGDLERVIEALNDNIKYRPMVHYVHPHTGKCLTCGGTHSV